MRWIPLLTLMIATALGCQPATTKSTTPKSSGTTTAKPGMTIEPGPPPAPVTPPPMNPPEAKPVEDPASTALQDISLQDLRAKLASDAERNAAATALALRGEEALPVLTEALEDPEPKVRAAAAFSLGQMGDKATSALDALRKRIAEDDQDAVKTAALFAVDAIEGK